MGRKHKKKEKSLVASNNFSFSHSVSKDLRACLESVEKAQKSHNVIHPLPHYAAF